MANPRADPTCESSASDDTEPSQLDAELGVLLAQCARDRPLNDSLMQHEHRLVHRYVGVRLGSRLEEPGTAIKDIELLSLEALVLAIAIFVIVYHGDDLVGSYAVPVAVDRSRSVLREPTRSGGVGSARSRWHLTALGFVLLLDKRYQHLIFLAAPLLARDFDGEDAGVECPVDVRCPVPSTDRHVDVAQLQLA